MKLSLLVFSGGKKDITSIRKEITGKKKIPVFTVKKGFLIITDIHFHVY